MFQLPPYERLRNDDLIGHSTWPKLALPLLACLSLSCATDSYAPNAPPTSKRSPEETWDHEMRIDEAFRLLLSTDPILAQGAVRIVRVKASTPKLYLVSVGLAGNPAPGQETVDQKLEMRRVALARAQAQVVEYSQVQVATSTRIATVSVIDGGGPTVTEMKEHIESVVLLRASGLLRGAAIVGTWYSPGRRSFQVAIAVELYDTQVRNAPAGR